MQGKPILSCGNFTTYLFEKVSIKELFSSELQYQKVNYVLADIHNFNDIKDFSSLEEYKKKHPT
jgi:1-phosphatidylinositol-4-phosphate 5-kinase/1-phosphatidylinositol-3-phosphate 5-kinase